MCTGEKTTMLSITGDQGTEWHNQTVSIVAPASKHNYRIEIVGIIGPSYQSDAALDDISIVEGLCGSKYTFFISVVYRLYIYLFLPATYINV